jgi:hypothetical protein
MPHDCAGPAVSKCDDVWHLASRPGDPIGSSRLTDVPRASRRVDDPFARRATIQKPAACFARRVKRVLQKYISFRMTEIMI